MNVASAGAMMIAWPFSACTSRSLYSLSWNRPLRNKQNDDTKPGGGVRKGWGRGGDRIGASVVHIVHLMRPFFIKQSREEPLNPSNLLVLTQSNAPKFRLS